MRLKAFIAGFSFTLTVLCVLALLLLYATSPDRYNLLVVGSDQRGTERARSDILFVVSFPKSATQRPTFISIPRDTKIEHPDWGLQKITHFYALGERPQDGKALGNIGLTAEAVEQLLGIEIDATLEVTFASFESLISEVGGATVNGATVSAQEALGIVRDRFSDGRSDFDRQADAREILRSTLTKIKTPTMARTVFRSIQNSNQSRLQYDRYPTAHFLYGAAISRRGHVSIGEMEELVVPGESAKIYTPAFGKELYYWIPDTAALDELITTHLTQ